MKYLELLEEVIIIISILKEIRQKKGYTQDYMAKKLGYKNKSGYCMLEKGLVKMTLEKARVIAEILDIDPTIFFESYVQETTTNKMKNKIST